MESPAHTDRDRVLFDARMPEHEWVTLRERRWCLGCYAFGTRRAETDPWSRSSLMCPRNTPRARREDDARKVEPAHEG